MLDQFARRGERMEAKATAKDTRSAGDDSSAAQGLELTARVLAIHHSILEQQPQLCAERALLVTDFFRSGANSAASMAVTKAEALRHIVVRKGAHIYPDELLVGCYTSHRVGGGIFPELHGLAMLEDLFRYEKRRVNPFTVDRADRWRLLRKVVPYWAPRILALRAFSKVSQKLRILRDQLSPISYLINELGGISHFVPDYERLLEQGTEGYRSVVRARLGEVAEGSKEADFLQALLISCDGLEQFADNYRREALEQAEREGDAARRRELEQIAAVCARVPRHPARSFQEALQSLLFAQVALNLESLDNSVSPGRLDQILWPYYERDIESGAISRQHAFELLGCFALKMCEIVPVFSRRVTRFHGGLFNGQVLVVGGIDRQGRDATNELTYLFVELMDRLRTRQPNYHARLHKRSPKALRHRIASALADGAVSPALYNDEVIVDLLVRRGFAEEDARDYANVGCVEPTPAGCSFLSTDAALLNFPLCLELALNRGRRFGKMGRIGAATPAPETCSDIDGVVDLFAEQVRFAVEKLVADLRAVEIANARFHPTPLTSMLVRGCIESATDVTEGGAIYNGSGIQGVGVVEVGDSLAAIQSVVFEKGAATLDELVRACKNDFRNADQLRARLQNAPKYGNDEVAADRFTARAMAVLADTLTGMVNTRGGRYVAGFYSVTAHVGFGEVVGALPSGRPSGEPFSSGISPCNGMDRAGPTAVLKSQANLPLERAFNGVNFNLTLTPWLGGEAGWVDALVSGGFDAGCMQMQVNVLDPAVLVEARDHPERFPGLLVRVSGYSAYFGDLTPELKQEVIDRFSCEATD